MTSIRKDAKIFQMLIFTNQTMCDSNIDPHVFASVGNKIYLGIPFEIWLGNVVFEPDKNKSPFLHLNLFCIGD